MAAVANLKPVIDVGLQQSRARNGPTDGRRMEAKQTLMHTEQQPSENVRLQVL
jgi:hypothetical protein